MGSISKLPGWFALFGGTDRSGRPGATDVARRAGVSVLGALAGALRDWQARNEMRAAIRNIDERMLKDIGRDRADFDALMARLADDRAALVSKRWLF